MPKQVISRSTNVIRLNMSWNIKRLQGHHGQMIKNSHDWTITVREQWPNTSGT